MEKNIKLIANLKGFSGCQIKLYSKNGNYFVRKISKSIEYNERLKNQMSKQKYFLEYMSTEKITTPKVLEHGFIEDLFFFDMEYIQGTNLIDYIYDAETKELLTISGDLNSLISIMKKNEQETTINDLTTKIKIKIREIQDKLPVKIDQEIFEEMKRYIDKTNIPEIKETFCHGDLTMENIIYDEKEKKYYLIDLLDSFVNHYWFDITKLFQDMEGKWYKFRNPQINMNNMLPKMNIITNILHQSLINNEEIYKKSHNLFLAVNFSRILPYAKEKDFTYLTEVIKKNMEKFRILNETRL